MRAMTTVLAATVWLGSAVVATAGSIVGVWLTDEGASKVQIEPCAATTGAKDTLCGRLIWLREPNDAKTGAPLADKKNPDATLRSRPLLGLTLITSIKPAGDPDEWKARAYNAEDGKTYDVTLHLQEDGTLELEGCGLAGLICQGETWTRATD